MTNVGAGIHCGRRLWESDEIRSNSCPTEVPSYIRGHRAGIESPLP